MNKKQFKNRHRDRLGEVLNLITAAVIVLTVMVLSRIWDDIGGMFQ